MTVSDCGGDKPMRIVGLSRGWRAGAPAVLALGSFDGVHLAHRRLIELAADMAARIGAVPAVFTFREGKGDGCLTDLDGKLRLLSGLGPRYAVCADFSALRNLSPEQFFREILIGRLNAAGLACGFNFRFGKGAAGDTGTLAGLCRESGVELEILPPVMLDGAPVSSTRIRDALREGNPGLAAAMLGRPFALEGEIVHGRQVGRQNGCPTLNLPLKAGIVVPKFGVYFTRCIFAGRVCRSVSNIGVRPTFDELCGAGSPLCEVHLLDGFSGFAGLTAGLPIRVELDAFLRPERKFDSTAALYRQIAEDVAGAKEYYNLR